MVPGFYMSRFHLRLTRGAILGIFSTFQQVLLYRRRSRHCALSLTLTPSSVLSCSSFPAISQTNVEVWKKWKSMDRSISSFKDKVMCILWSYKMQYRWLCQNLLFVTFPCKSGHPPSSYLLQSFHSAISILFRQVSLWRKVNLLFLHIR